MKTSMIDPVELSLADLRAERSELQDTDDAVSYVRRLVQARVDIVAEERKHRIAGGHLNLAEDLPAVLSRHLTGGPARPPRPATAATDHPLAIELDQICAEVRADHIADLDDDELDEVSSRLEAFEHSCSAERREVFTRLDALSAELVRRYRDGQASVDGLLADE